MGLIVIISLIISMIIIIFAIVIKAAIIVIIYNCDYIFFKITEIIISDYQSSSLVWSWPTLVIFLSSYFYSSSIYQSTQANNLWRRHIMLIGSTHVFKSQSYQICESTSTALRQNPNPKVLPCRSYSQQISILSQCAVTPKSYRNAVTVYLRCHSCECTAKALRMHSDSIATVIYIYIQYLIIMKNLNIRKTSA